MRRAVTITIAAALVSALAAVMAWFGLSQHAAATAPRPVWTEVAWPFPIDQWGKGKAFRCKAADCGAEVNIYLVPSLASAIARPAWPTTTISIAWVTLISSAKLRRSAPVVRSALPG